MWYIDGSRRNAEKKADINGIQFSSFQIYKEIVKYRVTYFKKKHSLP